MKGLKSEGVEIVADAESFVEIIKGNVEFGDAVVLEGQNIFLNIRSRKCCERMVTIRLSLMIKLNLMIRLNFIMIRLNLKLITTRLSTITKTN